MVTLYISYDLTRQHMTESHILILQENHKLLEPELELELEVLGY